MKKVAVVTDSIACLPRELVDRYRIGIVPLNILFEGRVYRDWIDITPTQAYDLFLKNPDAWATSAPAPGEFLTAYYEAAKLAESVVCITLSSQLSSTHDMALTARDIVAKEKPNFKIEVIESGTAAAAEGFVALAAARAAENGADFSGVINAALAIKQRVNVYVLLDTIRHVYRSGRIPKIAAKAGSLLNIRPIFRVKGKVHLATIVRSRERGIETIFGKVRTHAGNKPIHAAVMHVHDPEAAEDLTERVRKTFNCLELWQSDFSPLMGYACGTSTLALAFYPEN